MESKIVQFLPPDFVADCRFLMDNGRHNFETLALTARTLVEHVKGKKEAPISGEEPGPKARILLFSRSKESPYSIFDLARMGFELWGYRYPTIKRPSPVTSVYAMMEKAGVFYEYVYEYGDGSDPVNRISEISKDRLLDCYKRFGPRTGRFMPPKWAIRILPKASGCTALESEP